MRRYLFLIVFIIFSVTGWAKGKDGYVVATSEAVRADAAWMKVVDALVKKHKADVIFYKENIGELQKPLRQLRPRFVAFVEKPEFLNREYVMGGYLCRLFVGNHHRVFGRGCHEVSGQES